MKECEVAKKWHYFPSIHEINLQLINFPNVHPIMDQAKSQTLKKDLQALRKSLKFP